MSYPAANLSEIFHALGSEPRLVLVDALHANGGEPLCVSELADLTEMPRLKATHHLEILRRCGVMDAVRDDRRRLLHTLRTDRLHLIEDWLYAVLDDG